MKSLRVFALLLTFFAFSIHASETVEGVKKDYQTFKEKMAAKLEDIDKKIEKLKVESKNKGKEVGDKTLEDLKIARTQLQIELDQAKETSSSKWSQFKKGFAKSVDQLNSKIQQKLKE